MGIKRLIPLVGIALVVAIISTAIFYSLFAGRLSGAAPSQAARSALVVAARDLKAGSAIAGGDVTVIPLEGVRQRLKGTFSSVEQVAGKTAYFDVRQGEPLLESQLVARDGTGTGVPEGMRAVSVHVSDSSGVVAMLKPGYKVDVQVFASRSPRLRPDGVRTILRGVTVLSAGAQPETSSQGYFSAPVVTLLAPARDAEELALADSYARLRITLRNPLEAVASPPQNSPADTAPTQFMVRSVEVTDEGYSKLAATAGLGINTSDIAGFQASVARGWAHVQSQATVLASPHRLAYYDLPSEDAAVKQVRIGISAIGKSRLRVRPELVGTANGRVETRSVETSLDLKPDGLIVVSGLSPAAAGRRILVVISKAS
jgi:Flp pilus assembly protein CpaB